MTGKTRWQSPPAVQLPDRANTFLAFPTQGVPHFYPFPPCATAFGSSLDTPMLHAAVFISTLCSVLLCWLGLHGHRWHVLPLFGAGGCLVATSSPYVKMNR